MKAMEEHLPTIWLYEALEQQLEVACTDSGRSRCEIVQEALRRHLPLLRFEHLRGQALPFGEAAGWLTDNGVFRVVS